MVFNLIGGDDAAVDLKSSVADFDEISVNFIS